MPASACATRPGTPPNPVTNDDADPPDERVRIVRRSLQGVTLKTVPQLLGPPPRHVVPYSAVCPAPIHVAETAIAGATVNEGGDLRLGGHPGSRRGKARSTVANNREANDRKRK